MASEFVCIRMADLTSPEIYSLLTAIVVPRPIALLSTVSASGKINLAPFSFFMMGGTNPPSLVWCPTVDEMGRPKNSLLNVLDTGEFVVNSVQRDMAAFMLQAAASPESNDVPAGLGLLASSIVKPPRIAESHIQLECRLHQVVEHGSGPGAARYVIGEVLIAHVAPDIARDPTGFKPISRLGGRVYADLATMETFRMGDAP